MRKSGMLGGMVMAAIAMAKQAGLKIIFRGTQAYATLKEIVVPEVDPKDPNGMIKTRGYLAHETAHKVHTNWKYLWEDFTNIFEDIRVEREQSIEYPGEGTNYKNLVKILVDEGEAFTAENDDPIGKLLMLTVCRERNRVLGQSDIAVRELENELYCRGVMGDQFMGKFFNLADEVEKTTSTKDCKKLAERVWNLIKSESKGNPPPSPGQSGNSGNNQEQGQSQGSGEPGDPGNSGNKQQQGTPSQNSKETGKSSRGSGETSESAEGSGEPGNTPGKTDASDKAGNSESGGGAGDGAGDGAGGNDTGSQGMTNEQRQALNSLIGAKPKAETDFGKMLQNAVEDAANQSCNAKIPGTKTISDGDLVGAGSTCYENFKNQTMKMMTATGKLRGQLTGLFEAQYQKKSLPAESGSRLSKKNLYLVGVNTPDKRVFTTNRTIKRENTAVSILVDSSGSMAGREIELACTSGYAVAKCIDEMRGVTCNVGAFSSGLSGVMEVKSFEAKTDLRRFYKVSATGGTPTAEAILWAGHKLSMRRENRRLIILFTDGAPNNPYTAREAIKTVGEYGIETFVIIMESADKSGSRNARNWADEKITSPIMDIADLGGAMIQVLKKALLRRAA